MVETITSPQFVEKMRRARTEADTGGGLEAMGNLLGLESLRDAGADIPENFRLTSRVFEDKAAGLRSEVKAGADEPPPKRPYIVGCGGAGVANICGCGGGVLMDAFTTPAFQAVLAEMGELSGSQRPMFVQPVLLNDEELAARGITVPEGLLIQRSAFGDRRPTLFVVKKFLPKLYSDVWQNVNITFDNEYPGETVSRDPESCWRDPLPVDVQAKAISVGTDLESL